MFADRLPKTSDKTRSVLIRIAAFAAGLMLLFVLLLTSTQALCFWIPGWWRMEYTKYNTPANVQGEMSMDDAVHVTEDMLDYCIGKLDTLDNTEATIDGVKAPFFTEREKQHLADCRELFMKGMRAIYICILMIIGLCIYIFVHLGKKDCLRALAKGYLRTCAAVLAFALIVLVASMIDFTAVFTLFHKIFFNNDLWILNPSKDNLINIMQEDVFADAAMYIGFMWVFVSALLAVIAAVILRKTKA